MTRLGGKRVVWLGLLVMFIVFIIYVVWDNNRIVTVEEEIELMAADGSADIRILHVTDLHEKTFGENQQRLVDRINELEYDVIVFTGDMLDGLESTNTAPFFDLIEAVSNLEHALFVPGNSDPYSYAVGEDGTVEKSRFIQELEALGVDLVESVYSFDHADGQTYHFVYLEYAIGNVRQSLNHLEGGRIPWDHPHYESYILHHEALMSELDFLEDPADGEVVIALNHYPVQDERMAQIKQYDHLSYREFDLILAGHYHAGQFRVPFFGAFIIPEPYFPRYGLFPPQDRVTGPWQYENTKQYVSGGLGSGGPVPLLKFRLFNPPEINLLHVRGTQ
ncbi:metallophosphoesterase [Alteribacter lacisalsi]|nr:metallophosphoesterase [Alteribacter lacisalsi]